MSRRKRGKVELPWYKKDEPTPAVAAIASPVICSVCKKPRKQDVTIGAHSQCQTCSVCGELWGTCPCLLGKLRETTQSSAPTIPQNGAKPMPMASGAQYPLGGGGAYGTATPKYAPCSHAWQKFQVGPYDSLYITSYSDRSKTKFYPELGIYFTTSWDSEMKRIVPKAPAPPEVRAFGLEDGPAKQFVELAEEMRRKHKEADTSPVTYEIVYPGMAIDWPDRGILPMTMAKALINMTVASLKKGTIIETGCFAAHGRTGVFLALLLAQVEKLDATTAITEVRKRHCRKCVESASQIQMVFDFIGEAFTSEQIKALDR